MVVQDQNQNTSLYSYQNIRQGWMWISLLMFLDNIVTTFAKCCSMLNVAKCVINSGKVVKFLPIRI